MGVLHSIWRYPVKGLSGQSVKSTTLKVGGTLDHDRVMALARPETVISPVKQQWQVKKSYYQLSLNPKMAGLTAIYNEATESLSIHEPEGVPSFLDKLLRTTPKGKLLIKANVTTPEGQTAICQFFSERLGLDNKAPPRLIKANETLFADQKNKLISIMNLASIRDLALNIGAELDPLRFRGNLWVDGPGAFEEFSWVGKQIQMGDVVLKIESKIERCPATEVNPKTGERDQRVVLGLQKTYGHIDMGVFASVVKAGTIKPGLNVKLV